MAPTQLWFLRHGEVEPAAIGRFVGTSDVALSDLGHHQAQAIAAFLEDSPVDVVLSSPRRRSQDTVRPLAEAKGLTVETRDGFAEMHFGAWEHLTWPEIEARDPDFAAYWRTDPGTIACPGGQTANQFAAVVKDQLEEVLAEFEGRTVAVAAHAGVNRAILAAILERPYIEMFRFSQDYGCINAAAWGVQDWAQIALTNLVPGPQSPHPSW